MKQKLTKSEGREKRRSLSLKGRESFTICKELEEKLVDLEKKIGKLDASSGGTGIDKSGSKDTGCRASTVASRLRRKSLDSATSSEPMKVLIRMTSLENRVADLQKARPDAMNVIVEDGGCSSIDTKETEVWNIECAWRAKMNEIATERRRLQNEGRLDDETKTVLLAEKLAAETVFLNKLGRLMRPNDMAAETADRVNSRLECALVDAWADAEKITSLGTSAEKRAREYMDDQLCAIRKYKWDADRVKSAAYGCLEDAVTDTEMHVALDYYFRTQGPSESGGGGAMLLVQCAVNRARMESWLNEVRRSVETEIDRVVQCLPAKGKRAEDDGCLVEYFDVAVLRCMLETGLKNVAGPAVGSTSADGALSECQHLAAKLCRCLPPAVDDERALRDSLGGVHAELTALRSCVEQMVAANKRQSSNGDADEPVAADPAQPTRRRCQYRPASWIADACDKCRDLRAQIASLRMYLARCRECQRCVYLQDKLDGYGRERDAELETIQTRHQADVAELMGRLEEEKRKLSAVNEQQQAALKDRVKKLEKRLTALDSEYSQQMDNLRLSYQLSLAAGDASNGILTEEATKRRYQTEIEHLRVSFFFIFSVKFVRA